MLSVIMLSIVMLRVAAPFWLSIQNMTKNNLLKGLDKQIGKTLWNCKDFKHVCLLPSTQRSIATLWR